MSSSISSDTTIADETEVRVPQAAGYGGTRVYHVDDECQYVTDRMQTWTVAQAEGWDIPPCSVCSEGDDA